MSTTKKKIIIKDDDNDVKKEYGQFYTTNATYILTDLHKPTKDIKKIIEPFAGNGDLIEWCKKESITIPSYYIV